MSADAANPEPLLRTLSPLLRNLDRELRGWMDGLHRYPLPMIARASLEGMAGDLKRQSEALDIDKPLLVIALMGGTGVGKSTLLNALAGSPIAQASFTRPTTRDPVVYHHESIRTDRLDPALRHCRLVSHDRESLSQKILVDTPDIDSNDLANREKLIAILPVADIVLYVGSQEKYHDQIGWELFKEQRKRRAFAFVLNKWDRCLHAGAAGLRPDEDLLRDLNAEGFQDPILFRTMAQSWLDQRMAGSTAPPPDLPEGEQFAELLQWLEAGLTRLEIEAVKARGVGQLLSQISQSLQEVRPPDLTVPAERTRGAWEKILNEEAAVYGEVLLSTLDPYQQEIEHHFSLEGQNKFRGLMGAYLRLSTKFRTPGAWRLRVPMLPKIEMPATEAPAARQLTSFANECTRQASEKVLDKRSGAIVNRLLVEADRNSFPLSLLNTPTSAAARGDWHQRYDRALLQSLAEVEQQWTQPEGVRRIVQVTLVNMANILPEVAFVGGFIWLLWRWIMIPDASFSLFHIVMPLLLTLAVLLVMQILIALLLPMRWSAVRSQFQEELVARLKRELTDVYAVIPEETARDLLTEREKVDQLTAAVKEVLEWLDQRQSSTNITGLYGK